MARVVVVGTGAVGGYFGGRLAAAGHDVTFVARGANLLALRSSGLTITGAMGDQVISPVSAAETVDGNAELVLLCTKAYDLPEAASVVTDVGGMALTLQNGVDAPSVAAGLLGDCVLAGTTGIVADLPEPGHVHVVSSYAWIRFGEPDGGGITPRVEAVQSILRVAGIQPLPAPDARVALWDKMALMCGMAGLTTLHQRPMGEILSDTELRGAFEAAVRECEQVARAKGVPLADDFVEQRLHYASQIDPAAMSSMSRDFARGRRIELDTFNGAIVRMGAELHIDVPANRAITDAIRTAR